MAEFAAVSTGSPRCPNHHEVLVDLPFPMVEKGEGTCPVSGVLFSYEMELDNNKLIKDVNGNVTPAKNWNVTGEE